MNGMRMSAYLGLSLLVGGSLLASTRDDFKKDLGIYFALPGSKAMALAIAGEAAAWGFSYSASTEADARDVALRECESQRQRQSIGSACRVILVGDTRIDAVVPEPVAAAPRVGAFPTYSVRWVNGTAFQVGALDSVQVWVSLSEDRDHVLVFVINGTPGPFTFEPASMTFTGERKDGQRATLTTYSAADYERKVRRRQILPRALGAFAAGYSSVPQPQTATVQGNATGTATVWGPNGWATGQASGFYSGTVTTYPSAEDYARARERAAAQTRAMEERLASEFQAVASTLARTQTVDTQAHYGGAVYFEKYRGNRLTVEVPVAGRTFSFEFPPAPNMNAAAPTRTSATPVQQSASSAVAPAIVSPPSSDSPPAGLSATVAGSRTSDTGLTWTATLANTTGREMVLSSTVQFVDLAGNVVAERLAPVVRIPPFTTKSVTGTETLDTEVASRVAHLRLQVRPL